METSDFIRSLTLDEQRVRNAQLQKLSTASRWLQSFANSQKKRRAVVSEEVTSAIGCISEVLRSGRIW